MYIQKHCAVHYLLILGAPCVTMDFTNIPELYQKTFKYRLTASILIDVEVFCSLKCSILLTSPLEKELTESHMMVSSQLECLSFCISNVAYTNARYQFNKCCTDE